MNFDAIWESWLEIHERSMRTFKSQCGNEKSNCVMERMKSNKTSVQRKTSWDLKLIKRQKKKGCHLLDQEKKVKEQAFSGFEYYKWTSYI